MPQKLFIIMYIQDINGINFIQTSRGVNSNNATGDKIEVFRFNEAASPQNTEPENADTLIEKNIKDGTLEQVLGETIPNDEYRAKVLELLNPENQNIETFADENDPGCAQWNAQSRRIIINTTTKSELKGQQRKTWNSMPAGEKLKVLVHEAMHGAQDTAFNTRAEEMLCEKTAIKTAAMLAEKNNLGDVILYPPSYTLKELGAMPDEELEKVLEAKFLANGYSNRIKDNSGAVTITGANGSGIDIPAGSKILVGEREYEIGEVFIEGRGANSGTICNFFTVKDGQIRGLGVVTFDNITPQVNEINDPAQQRFLNPGENDHYNNAVIIIDGKEYNMKIFDFTPEV